MMIGQVAKVSPTSIYNGEPAAVDAVRKALESRLSAEGASSDVSNNTLAFYDKGVAAAKEARAAQDALPPHGATTAPAVGGGPSTGKTSAHGGQGSSTGRGQAGSYAALGQKADQIRAHRAVGDLYQFGRTLGATPTGTEAQALAWIIAANRFMTVNDLPPQLKSLAAEPLFSGILYVPAPPPPAGRAVSNWNEYLGAAARTVAATSATGGRAVGGGPGAANEKANMQEVVRTTQERLQVLGQQLPPSSDIRSEVDRTVADLRSFEASAAQATPPSTQHKPTQKKPQQTPKK
jgi:hypothetical protein